MERIDEFIELKKDLEHTPAPIEYTVREAITRAKKHRRKSILWKAPFVSFGSIAILFVLLVNLFPAVALAMSNVPFLEDLVRAVAFDPSLKLAVENDYVQIVNETQTKEDVSVTIEYMIIDAAHISLFYTIDAPVIGGICQYEVTAPDGSHLPAVLCFDTAYKVGHLKELKMDFVEGNRIPEEFIFDLTVNVDTEYQELRTVEVDSDGVIISDPPIINSSNNYVFRFHLKPEEKYIQVVESIPLNQWIVLKEQRVYLESLDIYPTQARLYYHCDKENSAILDSINIYFEDENGGIYDTKKGGLVASGDPSVDDKLSLYFESSYFTNVKHLRLFINEVSLIDKKKLYGVIDLSTKTISNLPEGVVIETLEQKGTSLKLSLSVVCNKEDNFSGLISSQYYDIDGSIYSFGSWSCENEDKYTYKVNYVIEDYKDRYYKIKWSYAPIQLLEETVEITIK